jgi:hypothetical protein
MSSYRSKRRRIQQEVKNTLEAMSSHGIQLPLNVTDHQQLISTGQLDFGASSYPINFNFSNEENEVELEESELVDSKLASTILANWSIRHNIKHTALTDLLKVIKPLLKEEYCLPTCSKTLLHTPRNVVTYSIPGGKCFYFGVKEQILKQYELGYLVKASSYPIVCRMKSTFPNLLTLTVGTDGVPISKSSNISMWPILFRIDQSIVHRPLLAGLFCGESKPASVNDFLEKFISEMRSLESDGLILNGVKYEIRISCIICDAPARSFIKSIKGHTAYHSCERCVDEGEWEGRIIMACQSSNLRTDQSFFLKTDSDHHVATSPFSMLNIGLVSQVVLDYMHLICLGVVRKLMNLWVSGPLATRLPARSVNIISEALISISKRLPSEFARKTRSLKDLKRFKATELRQFLLYVGPTVLKGVLPEKLYYNFMLLHSATYILLSKSASNKQWNDLARSLLLKFVKSMSNLYSKTSVVYNVHALLHVSDDSLNFGSFDNVSAFSFENYMQFLKKLVRGQKLHLEQVVNRVFEFEATQKNSSHFLKEQRLGPIKVKSGVAKKYNFEKFCASNKPGDNVFITKLNNVIKIEDIRIVDENVLIDYRKYLFCKAVREYPIPSLNVGVRLLKNQFSDRETINSDQLLLKCVVLPYVNSKNKFLCVPLLHTV